MENLVRFSEPGRSKNYQSIKGKRISRKSRVHNITKRKIEMGRRITPLAVLTLFVVVFFSSTSTSSSSEKVEVALYYETLCPYCSNLIVNYLYKIFDDGLYDIVDFKLIPYGNAKIRNNTIVCQVIFFSFSFPFFQQVRVDV